MKEYSGPGTLAKLSGIIKTALAGKQNMLTPDNTVHLNEDRIGVRTPVRGVYTQAAYDALSEEEKAVGLYILSDAGGGAAGGNQKIPTLTAGKNVNVVTTDKDTEISTKERVEFKYVEIIDSHLGLGNRGGLRPFVQTGKDAGFIIEGGSTNGYSTDIILTHDGAKFQTNTFGEYVDAKVSGIAAPTQDNDAANKAYVDAVAAGAGGGIPSGGIIIWSGASDAVPSGWALCDGENGTPDLRGRFVLGASSGYSVGDTGGAEEVTLKVRQMPKHAHAAITETNISENGENTFFNPEAFVKTIFDTEPLPNPDNPNFSGYITSTGNNEPHPNMPPYYVLAYIMKL